MRAAVLEAYGEPPVVSSFDDPEAGEGQLVVDVLAAGLNPIDLRMASGTMGPDRNPPLPSVVGSEGIGRTPDGRRIYFFGCVKPFGALAERTLLPAGDLLEVPDEVEDAQAVVYGIAGSAGWLSLSRRGQVRRGETVVVLGASGVVGLVAVQAAKLLGAGRVVAAARSEEGLRRAAELGADATVRLDREGAELTAALAEAAGGPVDLVVDPLWGAPAAAAMATLRPGGRLVNLGQSAGATAELPSSDLRFKELSILGHTNFAATREELAGAMQTMWGHVAAGELTIDVETVPLDAAPDAWRRQAGSPGRKLVVVP